MNNIKLVLPSPAHRAEAEAYKQEFVENGEPVINGSALLDQLDYLTWLKRTELNSSPETVAADWVPSSTFFAVRTSDEKIIGMIDIRSSIDTDFLRSYGGHIGYSVRPSERRKGYATEMLRQALAYARLTGLPRVMLGCYSDNIGSKRTIEACGGKLTETKPYLDGKPMDIYWISLTEA